MAEPEEIVARVDGAPRRRREHARGKRVLVTAGGTREPLDAVRFVGNRSSGRMGVALADEARGAAREVTLLAANLAVPAPAGVEVVRDADRGRPRARGARTRGRGRDPDGGRSRRLPAGRGDRREAAEGRGAVDGRARADDRRRSQRSGRARRTGQVLVGFGAERGEDGLARKRRMLRDKNVDLVVFNDVSRDDIGFDAAENEVVLVARAASASCRRRRRTRSRATILDEVERLLADRR